jgi:hypothetical protein
VSRISRDYSGVPGCVWSHQDVVAEFGSMRSRHAACGGAHSNSRRCSPGRPPEPRHCARPSRAVLGRGPVDGLRQPAVRRRSRRDEDEPDHPGYMPRRICDPRSQTAGRSPPHTLVAGVLQLRHDDLRQRPRQQRSAWKCRSFRSVSLSRTSPTSGCGWVRPA